MLCFQVILYDALTLKIQIRCGPFPDELTSQVLVGWWSEQWQPREWDLAHTITQGSLCWRTGKLPGATGPWTLGCPDRQGLVGWCHHQGLSISKTSLEKTCFRSVFWVQEDLCHVFVGGQRKSPLYLLFFQKLKWPSCIASNRLMRNKGRYVYIYMYSPFIDGEPQSLCTLWPDFRCHIKEHGRDRVEGRKIKSSSGGVTREGTRIQGVNP